METSTPPPSPGSSPRLFGRGSRIAATIALCAGLATGGYAIASAASSTSTGTDTTTTATAPDQPGDGDHGWHHGPGAIIDRSAIETAIAGAIGITTDQLATERAAGKSVAEIATAHGKTVADVTTAVSDALTKAIDAAAAKGTITTDEATEAKGRVADLADHLVNGSGPGFGHDGVGGHDGGHGILDDAVRAKLLTAAATAIGISEADLKAELEAGTSLAASAVKHGKTAADVTKALTDTATSEIDAAVKGGKLTADQATALKAKVPAIVAHEVNETDGGGSGDGSGRHGGHCDHDGDQNGADQSDQGSGSDDSTTTTTTPAQVPAT